jgi:prophage DNA circulation protein
MSEQDRILKEIAMDDSMIQQDHYEAYKAAQCEERFEQGEALLSDEMQQILAEDAYHKQQAMREAMPQPPESNDDPDLIPF